MKKRKSLILSIRFFWTRGFNPRRSFSNISNINVAKIIKCITKLKDNGFSVILTNLKYDELDIADHIYLLTNEGLSEFKRIKK